MGYLDQMKRDVELENRCLLLPLPQYSESLDRSFMSLYIILITKTFLV